MTPLLVLLIVAIVGVFDSGMGISPIFTPIPVSRMPVQSIWLH